MQARCVRGNAYLMLSELRIATSRRLEGCVRSTAGRWQVIRVEILNELGGPTLEIVCGKEYGSSSGYVGAAHREHVEKDGERSQHWSIVGRHMDDYEDATAIGTQIL